MNNLFWKLFSLLNPFRLPNNGALLLLMVSGMNLSYSIFTVLNERWIIAVSDAGLLFNTTGWFQGLFLGYVLACKLIPLTDNRVTQLSAALLLSLSGFLTLLSTNDGKILLIAKIVGGTAGGLMHSSYLHHGAETSPRSVRGFIIARGTFYTVLGGLVYNLFASFWNFELNGKQVLGIMTIAVSLSGGFFVYLSTIESPVSQLQFKQNDLAAVTYNNIMYSYGKDMENNFEDIDDLSAFIRQKLISGRDHCFKICMALLLKTMNILTFSFPLNQIAFGLLLQAGFHRDLIIPLILVFKLITIGIGSLMIDEIGRRKMTIFSGLSSSVFLILVAIMLTIDTASSLCLHLAGAFLLMMYSMAGFALAFVTDIYISETFDFHRKYSSICLVGSYEAVLHLLLIVISTFVKFNYSSLSYILFSSSFIVITFIGFIYYFVPETKMLHVKYCAQMIRHSWK